MLISSEMIVAIKAKNLLKVLITSRGLVIDPEDVSSVMDMFFSDSGRVHA